MMRVVIGSTNKTKIAACKTAFDLVGKTFGAPDLQRTEFVSMASQTEVPDMPLTSDEIMKGALQRALFAYKEMQSCTFAVGMEGGVFEVSVADGKKNAYLQNWVYVYDGRQGYFGSSPALPLPLTIQKALYEEGRELAEIIDTLSGKSDVRSKNGAFGILTHDLITRTASFEWAVINALVPFFNKEYYGEGMN